MEQRLALKVNEKDNVATVFTNGVDAGATIIVVDKRGETRPITVRDAIPYGHKVAIAHIRKGALIMKYGEEIGIATSDIDVGDYVHVHNLDSMRARGDWAKEGR